MKTLRNYNELLERAGKSKSVFLLLYKAGSEQSECALEKINEIEKKLDLKQIYSADVNVVKDIHTNFGIKTVPTLLEFKEDKLTNVIKGCQSTSFFENYLNSVHTERGLLNSHSEKRHQVVVYSTPTCSWCNTLKSYLRTNNIGFRDIDVSKDEKAAQEMVRRSGQQGVPQSIMNGQLIIGFDKNKIDQILEINTN